MPNVSFCPSDTKDDDLPLLNANVNVSYEESVDGADAELSDAVDNDNEVGGDTEEDAMRRRCADPDDDGKYRDDPLWFGKDMAQIRYATDLEKSNGNAASRDGDWKRANRYWKNALRGAEKLKDAELEVRLRLNLALGYVQREKTEKALEHCDEIFRERLKSACSKSLIAKAHYRRAEAYIAAGDEAKGMRSLRAVLDVEPANSDARKRIAQIRVGEQERRERERALFRDKLAKDMASTGAEDEEASSSASSEPKERPPPKKIDEETRKLMEQLTDRKASARLVRGLHGENVNYRVGQPEMFCVPSLPGQ